MRQYLTNVNTARTFPNMGTRQVDKGPVGIRACANMRALREARGLSLAALSARLTEVGRPMLPSGLSKLEVGQRRMDVDDLVALSVALGVNPSRLLLPVDAPNDQDVELTRTVTCPAWRAWQWADGDGPFDDDLEEDTGRFEDFHLHARPAALRRAAQHPAARSTATIRARVLRLVHQPPPSASASATGLELIERDLVRLRFELDDLKPPTKQPSKRGKS